MHSWTEFFKQGRCLGCFLGRGNHTCLGGTRPSCWHCGEPIPEGEETRDRNGFVLCRECAVEESGNG